MTFDYYAKLAEINTFFHYRMPTPLDKQGVVRMNRDTLYSGALIDTSNGARLHFPEVLDDRYVSVMLVDNDHYVQDIIREPGLHDLPQSTSYLFAVIRIQMFDASDPDEIELINHLQDQFRIEAGSAVPFAPANWDQTSLAELKKVFNAEFADYDQYPSDWAGKPGTVNEQTRHLAAVGAWALLPDWEATYINYAPKKADNESCYMAVYTEPENNAFWSITMYDENGKMFSENGILNPGNTSMNSEGEFTAYFGSRNACPNLPNRLVTVKGWNFLMRVYRPGKSVLDKRYKLPDVRKVDKAAHKVQPVSLRAPAFRQPICSKISLS